MALSPAGLSAQQSVTQNAYYSLVYLALATIAYTDSAKTAIAKVGTDLPAAVTGLPALPQTADSQQTVAGSWQMVWGPAVDADNSNLLYVCHYVDAEGSPVFAAVVARGTDIYAGGLGLAQQLFQDLGDAIQVSWANALAHDCLIPSLTTEAKIAQGTCSALATVTKLTAVMAGQQESMDIAACLATYLSAHPGTPVVVTGHSLGGALTTVLAPYLAAKVPGATIVPQAFAPPTAGNGLFASTVFDAGFANPGIWINTLDMVPCAYGDVNGILLLWAHQNPAGAPCPGWLATIIKGLGWAVPPFAQPAKGVTELPGAVKTGTLSWVDQLEYQHFPPVYHTQISALPGTAPYPLPHVDTGHATT
ncbi:hypothetical protein M2352_000780 [Azospirillum fermentarium]|uniref:lipase family protein n=1 Tax=Azospirillum fermentarium TaxID=1233114 RepID=UPI0022275E3A|nr:lipase family protein [Azospirillum fermentarium]MCW2245189.1 hypothetical protein [Azospirillum fermentarium]